MTTGERCGVHDRRGLRTQETDGPPDPPILEKRTMRTFPNSPRLIKAGIVLLDPETAAVRRIISLQYNPDTADAFVPNSGCQRGWRRRPFGSVELKVPPVETIKLEAEIDATDQLEFPEQNSTPSRSGFIRSSRRSKRSFIPPASSSSQTTRSQNRVRSKSSRCSRRSPSLSGARTGSFRCA